MFFSLLAIGAILVAVNLSWNLRRSMLLIMPDAMAVLAAANSDEPEEAH